MSWSTLFLIALLLACPLMMVFMHRGGHGAHAHGGDTHHGRETAEVPTLEDLRRRRDELDAQIAALEEQPEPEPEAEEPARPATPVAP